jgi:hypothetical protein
VGLPNFIYCGRLGSVHHGHHGHQGHAKGEGDNNWEIGVGGRRHMTHVNMGCHGEK